MPSTVKPNGRSFTGPQTVVLFRGAVDRDRWELGRVLPASYDTYRTMRKQPTIALARALSIAPVIAAEWSVEANPDAPDEWVNFVREQMMPAREELVQQIMCGRVDYGWCPFEMIWKSAKIDGIDRLVVDQYKPLLPDFTTILAVYETGQYAGLKQTNAIDGREILLDPEYTMLVSFDVEGTNWYGRSLLENIREIYTDWNDANLSAGRYDRKVAGDHWVIIYPEGTTPEEGSEVSNAVIAQRIIDTLESAGSVALPAPQETTEDDDPIQQMPPKKWDIDMKSGSGQQGNFIMRMDYCDKLFVRGLLTPERTVLEGQYGTKAEAGVHTDWALTERELEHRYLTRQVNKQAVDPLLRYNYGEDAVGKVWLNAAPLADDKIAFFRTLYQGLLANPVSFIDAWEAMDFDAIMEAIDVPKRVDIAGEVQIDGTTPEGALAESLQKLYQAVNAKKEQAAGA